MKTVSIISNMDFSKKEIKKLESIGKFEQKNISNAKGEELLEAIGDADFLIAGSSGIEFLGTEILDKVTNLKLISVLGAGTDFIDLKAAKENNILIANAPGGNSRSVAEYAIGCVLSLSRKINNAHNGARDGETTFLNYEGIELEGKTIGIFGFGEIGKRVAKISKGLDMNVLVHTRTIPSTTDVTFVAKTDLISKSDIIVVCVPTTNETKGFITSREIELMRQNVILVSISRENVIDQNAVLESLKSGKMFGYAMELDIGSVANNEFFENLNTIVTPHIAHFTKESDEKTNNIVINNILEFQKGNPINIVN